MKTKILTLIIAIAALYNTNAQLPSVASTQSYHKVIVDDPIYLNRVNSSFIIEKAYYYQERTNNVYDVENCGTILSQKWLPEVVTDPAAEGGVIIIEDGETVTMSLIVHFPHSYKWRKDGAPLSDNDNISGINTETLTLSNISDAYAGTYDCEVSWGESSIISEQVILQVSNPLPIELISFKAICNGNNVKINWATASEANNDYFTVLKSGDGKKWSELIRIPGAGNSNKVLDYSVSDDDYIGNSAFYQLMQTDYNGNSTLFNIALVDCAPSVDPIVTIGPNPFSKYTNIEINDATLVDNYKLWIYNILGTEVMNIIITNTSYTLDATVLPTGVYFYKLVQNGKVIRLGKLVSQQ